jgi:predicted esterase
MVGACSLSLCVAACGDGPVVRTEPSYGGGTGASGGSTGSGAESTSGGAGDPDGTPTVPPGAGVGDACSEGEPCRPGLACNADEVCEPSGETKPGRACVLSAECARGQCLARQCVAAGEGEAKAGCSSDADCAQGLRCAPQGLSLVCVAEGSGDVGAACATSADCFAGLGCFGDQCAPPPVGLTPVGQPWTGASCAEPVARDVKAYFEVPGAEGADEGDFFRLPFPSDVRLNRGKVDLSGFPTPGAGLLGVDPVELYVDALGERAGWGAYPTLYFRFSGTFDFDSLSESALRFVDVTDSADPKPVYWSRFVTDGRSNYICENFLAVRVPLGRPLTPGHTYAAFVLGEAGGKTFVGREDGKAIVRSDNLSAVLAEEEPGDAALAAAHAAFTPLRDYFAAYDGDDVALTPDNVLTATVFTVDPDLREPMTQLAQAVAAGDPPTASRWVQCGENAVSPCPQAEGDRGCSEDADGYDEYQALLSLPIFQQGEAPYLTPADGGAVDPSQPVYKDVCVSLTVPEGASPSAGWPTVVFAHGTGGNFRSHVRPEVAGVLAAATPKLAVLGIDQVEHGPRRGDSLESPNDLFFNFLNPAAALGNPLQGAADQLSVARFARTLDVDAATSTGSALKLDPSKLFFFGHSQGATEGSLMLPFGDDYGAAVLSGNGASLHDALRTKTAPQNVAAALPIILQDPAMVDAVLGPGVTRYHPVLALLQQWIDPADPLSFAPLLAAPLRDHAGKHVFQLFGVEDSYSPPVTMATFAVAAGLKQITPHESAEEPFTDSLSPAVAVGYQAASGAFTLGMRQYGAPATDGHFVAFDNQAANDDWVLFLTGAAGDTPPPIGR